jgi:hypothetical protein
VSRKGRKRLAVDIPISIHEDLRNIAAKHNLTMTRLIIRLIMELIKYDSKGK